jgi:acetyltransferase-like isoleucine patch superfamily enzyme
MKLERFIHIARMSTIWSAVRRAQYARKKHIYAGVGDNVAIQSLWLPLYPELIKFHNNIIVASGVRFITHDAAHRVLGRAFPDKQFCENVGCIEIMDNVFIGAGATILYNTRIGPNALIAAGSVVLNDVPANTIHGGVPSRQIGVFSEYVEKRVSLEGGALPVYKEKLDKQFLKYLWEDFQKVREGKLED